jgi:hypothetical protein
MSFVSEFDSLLLVVLVKRSLAAGEFLETMARRSHALTQQRFGKVI